VSTRPAPAYAELQATTCHDFLRGASHPHELVARARELGLAAIAITDRHTLGGVVRAHEAAREHGVRLVVGARIEPAGAPPLLCWPADRAAHARLSRLVSAGRRRAGRAGFEASLDEALEALRGSPVAAMPPEAPDPGFARMLARLREAFADDLHLVVHALRRGDDAQRLAHHAALARAARVRLLATNDVHFHVPERRALQDVLACIRAGVQLDAAGRRLFAHGERHLKAPAEMARLFARHPDAIAAGLDIVARCRFSLDELRYDYPDEPVPPGATAQSHLEALAWEGARRRWPAGIPGKVQGQIAHELALVAQLGYAPYFLTVHDIVAFARARGILCQGRGSAANSAVCYAIGITAVDPEHSDLLFERFVSAARDEPPDIDVDFEHERREEVIQYIYARYGRERAGLAATLIRYRPRSAIRDVGKALGLSRDVVARLADTVWGRGGEALDEAQVRAAGIDPQAPRVALALRLARELVGLPRHLSQHVGGFVIARGRLDEIVPVVDAAMEGRTVIEWDKDDLDALGILKIDVLALGMLSCIRRAFALVAQETGERLELATIPRDAPEVYEMLSRADSIGVFQVESRAQMNMLPRLRPACFYDLVIEVAIVRPGPIQGDMVHPYLRRREGKEPADLPSEELRAVLGRTLGVPLFQEQAMRIAIVAAGFSPEEADRLRRAMATFRAHGRISEFAAKFVDGMVARGYARDFAERCFRQIEGFGTYGFPESHAASFAHLVYVSAWLKRFHPAAFAAALLDSQPMGFYAPAQIVRDARDHGVEVRPPDVNASDWLSVLEAGGALRLGLSQVKGLGRAQAEAIVAARGAGYRDMAELRSRAGASQATLERLAAADAFASLALGRRQALWQVLGAGHFAPDARAAPLLGQVGAAMPPPPASLPEASLGEAVHEDYATLRLSLRAHPVGLLRERLRAASPRLVAAAELATLPDGARAAVAGLVLVRQQPGSAKGVIFMTLEDETGLANLVVWQHVFARFRRVVLGGRLVEARGRLQREGDPPHAVIHLVADALGDRSEHLAELTRSPPGSLLSPQASRGDEARPSSGGRRRGGAAAGAPDGQRQLFPSRDFH
jgi:error-prone DNA polymerase